MMTQSSCHPLPHVLSTLILLGLLALSGCGGDKDGSASVDRSANGPVLTLNPKAIKTFHFTWEGVEGDREYRLLEDPDGHSGYSPVATLAANITSYSLEVFLPGRINARYILQACNDEKCTDSAPVYVSGSLVEAIGYIKASNTGPYHRFGWSVALSDDGGTLAVGAPWEHNGATRVFAHNADNWDIFPGPLQVSGAVYVYSRNGSGWSQQAYVKASNAGVRDQFGHAVSLSSDGNTLAVGAPWHTSDVVGVNGDENDASSLGAAGAAYVFSRAGNEWSQQDYIEASNAEAGNQFGSSLSLSGDGKTLVVGAYQQEHSTTDINDSQSDNLIERAGAVYVFVESSSVWSQQAHINVSSPGRHDQFGYSVALSSDGDTLAVGAFGEGSNSQGINGDESDRSAYSSGAVYVFGRSADIWNQQAYVKASNTDAGDRFGQSVALSGDGGTLAVGAPWEGSHATGINGDQTDNSACGVSAGPVVVHSCAGAVYIYSRSDNAWGQHAYIKASNVDAFDSFGGSVALSRDGHTLAVGARWEHRNVTGINGDSRSNVTDFAGAAYVYTRSDGDWSQQAYVKASNTGTEDFFGHSVALSGDGDVLAVGAFGEGGKTSGINGDQGDNTAWQAGAVYLY